MGTKDWVVIVAGFGLIALVGAAAVAHKRKQEESSTATDRISRKINRTQAAYDLEKLDAAAERLQAAIARRDAAEARLKAAVERKAAREADEAAKR